MEEANKSAPSAWKQKLLLAKVLLRKYGMLHEFHISQLEHYPIACCKISLDGEARVYAADKTVVFDIKTSRKYTKKNGSIVERNKYSLLGKISVSKKAYEEEKGLAFINLYTWTRELLWGEETIVKVIIDGQQVSYPVS